MNDPIPARRPDEMLISKKKRTSHLVDLIVPAHQRTKIKASEKINKYLDLANQFLTGVQLVWI